MQIFQFETNDYRKKNLLIPLPSPYNHGWNTVLWISVLSAFHQCPKYKRSVRWILSTINMLIGVFSTFAILFYWANRVMRTTIVNCFCEPFKLWLVRFCIISWQFCRCIGQKYSVCMHVIVALNQITKGKYKIRSRYYKKEKKERFAARRDREVTLSWWNEKARQSDAS